MANTENKKVFKGIYQVTKAEFEKLTNEEKRNSGFIYLVRDTEGRTNEVHFGSRKYAESGDIKCGTF